MKAWLFYFGIEPIISPVAFSLIRHTDAEFLHRFSAEIDCGFPVSDQYIGTIELASEEHWQLGAASRALITGDEFVSGESIAFKPA